MSRDPEVYLQDILVAIQRIEEYTVGLDEERFRRDHLRQDAVVRNLEIVGEAVKQLPEEIRSRHGNIEWRKIAGLRDILIHQYFGIDVDIVWDVVQNKLAGLAAAVRSLQDDLRDDGSREPTE